MKTVDASDVEIERRCVGSQHGASQHKDGSAKHVCDVMVARTTVMPSFFCGGMRALKGCGRRQGLADNGLTGGGRRSAEGPNSGSRDVPMA